MPTAENFRWVEETVSPLSGGRILVQTIYLSVDPYIRGRMRNVRSYAPPLELDQVIEGGVVGRVVESKHPDFRPGDFVTGRLGWQDYAICDTASLRKLPNNPALLPAALGVLGMPGLTAYFALLEVGKPRSTETVVVSGAAGAVGMIVGQIAKLKGCRAVGIAGSDEKVRYLTEELGLDAGINYRKTENLRRALKDACPNGIDIYFDNVGGPISDAAITLIRLHARIIICGQISLYNLEKPEMGPRNAAYLLVNRARMEGFLVHDYVGRSQEGIEQLTSWVKSGQIKHRETIVVGLEKAPEAFLGLFRGENIGKQVVQVADLNGKLLSAGAKK